MIRDGHTFEKYCFTFMDFHFCQFRKRWAPNVLKIHLIHLKNHGCETKYLQKTWIVVNMGTISITKHKMIFFGTINC